MKAFIVYCHPSNDSLTKKVYESFIKGIIESGNTFETSDLYKMEFMSDITEKEYLRDANYISSSIIANDVVLEHNKINNSDAIVFIFPLFWTDVPAKLKGWFDRVWSFGFAYGERTMKLLEKSMVFCIAGHSIETLEQFGYMQSIKNVMMNDRISNRSKEIDFIVYDETAKNKIQNEKKNWIINDAFDKGKTLFQEKTGNVNLDGKYFTSIENSESGEVDNSTIFFYHQKNDIIWAEYQGGSIIKGSLVGKIDSNKLTFTYQHINTERQIKTGNCFSSLEILENRKYKIYESWQWSTGESGKSIIMEI